MSIYEALKLMTLDQMIEFWYLNAKQRGLKATQRFLQSEYSKDNCNMISNFYFHKGEETK